ncbi:MAG: zinc-binding dehydrogenase [Gallionella sp.]|nr:zinc-binding dehydrogenase [Gallionella sp.]
MKAIVVAANALHGMRIAEVGDPAPTYDQMVVEVSHASLNHGDLNDAVSGRIPQGGILGSDAVGTVVAPALCGRGPGVGARVLTMTSGAFAQYCLADLSATVPLPQKVESVKAATLPVAGLAALQSLKQAFVANGSRVLITGASGGVGRFAVQLARLKGAKVSAIAGRMHHATLQSLGAAELVSDIEELQGEFGAILDTVGGPQLAQAWRKLARRGYLVCIGSASGAPTTFEPYALIGPPKSLVSFLIGGSIADDLSELVGVLASGELAVDVAWEGPWTGIDEAVNTLLSREFGGKLVLRMRDV